MKARRRAACLGPVVQLDRVLNADVAAGGTVLSMSAPALEP